MGNQLSEKNWVVKQNTLNEMRSNDMTLQELRLFSVYLSKINPKDKSTRFVRFPLSDFQAIMEFKGSNIMYFKRTAKNLVTKMVFESLENGGFDSYTLFNRFRIMPNKDGEWYVDIDANETALPLLFDFKSHFFRYELWNALRLKSKNQLRMYEVLKQCERIGYKVASVEELRGLLGICDNEHMEYKYFKRDVLEVCRQALSENTDISFTYEPHGKKGRGGKILELKFTITKNKGFKDPLQLDEFIEISKEVVGENMIDGDIDLTDIDEHGNVRATGRNWKYEERITYLMTACNNEFSRDQVVILHDLMREVAPHVILDGNDSHDYLQRKYHEMVMMKPAVSRFGYLKTIITGDKR